MAAAAAAAAGERWKPDAARQGRVIARTATMNKGFVGGRSPLSAAEQPGQGRRGGGGSGQQDRQHDERERPTYAAVAEYSSTAGDGYQGEYYATDADVHATADPDGRAPGSNQTSQRGNAAPNAAMYVVVHAAGLCVIGFL